MPTIGCFPGVVWVTPSSSCCGCRACCACSVRMLRPALFLVLTGVRNSSASASCWKHLSRREMIKLGDRKEGEDTMQYAKEEKA